MEIDGESGMRPGDRAVLTEALERGYFDTPPAVTPSEIAAGSTLSETEVQRRLARGMATLMAESGEIIEEELSSTLNEQLP